MARGGIHKLIDSRDWEGVLWTCLVEICIVDADPSFSIGLFNHDYIRKPFRVMNLPDKLSCEQLFNFFVDCRVVFGIKPSAFLDDRLVRGVNFKPVCYDVRVNSRHVLMRPGEDVFMLFEETDELVPEASKQLQSHLDRVLWVLVVQFNGFQLLNGAVFLFPFPCP